MSSCFHVSFKTQLGDSLIFQKACFLKEMLQDVLTWYWEWSQEKRYKFQVAQLRSLVGHELHCTIR